MGMSASQMRYCMIAGKKSDVEFQGQQINQQRTTLATQSSTYNTQLLNMNVPTPPCSSDFSTTTYSFVTGSGEAATVSGVQFQADDYVLNGQAYDGGTWIVNYTTETTGSLGKHLGLRDIVNLGNGIYQIGTNGTAANNLEVVDLANYMNPDYPEQAQDFNNLLSIGQDCNIVIDVPNPPGPPVPTPVDTTAALAALPAGTFYKYTQANGEIQYFLAQDLPAVGQAEDVSAYYVDQDADITQSGEMGGAAVHWADSGRMSDFTVQDQFGNEVRYTLDISNVTDDEAYQDAFQEYEFYKDQYNKGMEDINAQISIIESQDKKLELKLQDLDTQQKALSTEMDSVKKVIDKNVETSFKTFA